MKLLRRCLYVISILLPLGLLCDTKAFFYSATDWNNHLWLIGYTGNYIKTHVSAPLFLNADNAIGVPINLFYGYLLYPILGGISTYLGASLALRIGCLLMVAFQFFGILSGSRAIFRHRSISYAVAISVIWGTYSLTDLYNRSAIPEYFATGFMMACIGFIFAAAEEKELKGRIFFIWMAAVSILMSFGIHPPTAFLESIFFFLLLLSIVKLVSAKLSQLTWPAAVCLSVASIGCALILVPWLYITQKIGPQLAQWAHPGVMLFYPDRCDTLLKRLSPLPLDWLSTQQGTLNVSTPYLEASLDSSLLILLMWGLYAVLKNSSIPLNRSRTLMDRAATPFISISIIWGLFLLALSVNKPLASHFLFLGTFVQFAYRITSHINATLLVCVFSGSLIFRRKGLLQKYQTQLTLLASICITVTSLNLINKLPHAQVITSYPDSPEYELTGDRSKLARNGQTGLASMYAATRTYPELVTTNLSSIPEIKLPVGDTGNKFGVVSDLDISFAKPNWVITNVIAFPWNRIFVNGTRVGGTHLSRVGGFFAIELPAGNSHIHWQIHADPYWAVLNTMSHLCLIGTLICTLTLFILALFSKIKFSVYTI
jgi:hypothetical protein